MKTTYKPLESLNKPSNDVKNPSKPSSGDSFLDMLTRKQKQAKQEFQKPDTSEEAAKNPWADVHDQNKGMTDNGLKALEELDTDYHSKGIKKKTLAANFSAANHSNLELRLKKYKHIIEMKAKKYGLDPEWLAGLFRQESNFNPYAVSHCGAMGMGQIMPETARYLGVKDPFNAAQNIDAAAKYLKEQYDRFGSMDLALAAYNAGPGAVRKYKGIPPYRETQNYVKAIRSHKAQISSMGIFKTDDKNPA